MSWGLYQNGWEQELATGHEISWGCLAGLLLFTALPWTMQWCPKPHSRLGLFVFLAEINRSQWPPAVFPTALPSPTQTLSGGLGGTHRQGSPSAIRCSGTCRVIFTTSGQLTWEEHTRPMTQLVMLMRVRVVLFTGLRGEPTGGNREVRPQQVRIWAVVTLEPAS